MTKLIDDAVKALRDMPENIQATAARAIIEYGKGSDEDLALSDEQVAEVERRIANPNRRFLSLPDLRHRLRHFGV